MSNLTFFSRSGETFDPIQLGFLDFSGIVSVSVTTTRVVVNYDDGTRDFYDGTGITASGTNIIGGTVNRIRTFDGGRLLADVTNLSVAATAIASAVERNDAAAFVQLVFSGSDTVRGNDGDDFLTGFAGNDTISGVRGDDTIFDQFGNNTIRGGAGDDILIYIGPSSSFTITPQGDELLVQANAGGNRNTVSSDVETLIFDDVILDTASLLDPATPPPEIDPLPALGAPTQTGSNADNRLTGSGAVDVIDSLGGRDIVKTFGGDDDIDLGSGNDVALSGIGDDIVRGGDGTDVIKTGPGADRIDGGDDMDVILSGTEDDIILGGGGDDVIKTGRGADQADGGAGDDTILGFRGDETLIGGAGDDLLAGNLDDDILFGGPGDDRLFGGPGRDAFLYPDAAFGNDRIVLDFRPGSDTIDFSGSGLTLSDLRINQVGEKVVIKVKGETDSIVVASDRFIDALGPLTVAGVENSLDF